MLYLCKQKHKYMDILVLKPKQKLTVIGLNGLAMTSKFEIQIVDQIGERYVIVHRGKRKKYYYRPNSEELIFENWDLPILVDTETNIMRGNACYNFITDDAEKLRQYIESKNINKEFENYAHIIWIHESEMRNSEAKENLLYPEIRTDHAVIERIKSKL